MPELPAGITAISCCGSCSYAVFKEPAKEADAVTAMIAATDTVLIIFFVLFSKWRDELAITFYIAEMSFFHNIVKAKTPKIRRAFAKCGILV
jgi:hypothetical protein